MLYIVSEECRIFSRLFLLPQTNIYIFFLCVSDCLLWNSIPAYYCGSWSFIDLLLDLVSSECWTWNVGLEKDTLVTIWPWWYWSPFLSVFNVITTERNDARIVEQIEKTEQVLSLIHPKGHVDLASEKVQLPFCPVYKCVTTVIL